jgi:hypothetical protein
MMRAPVIIHQETNKALAYVSQLDWLLVGFSCIAHTFYKHLFAIRYTIGLANAYFSEHPCRCVRYLLAAVCAPRSHTSFCYRLCRNRMSTLNRFKLIGSLRHPRYQTISRLVVDFPSPLTITSLKKSKWAHNCAHRHAIFLKAPND